MGQTETWWPSTKRNAKSSSCHGLIPCMSTGWESPGWTAALPKKTWRLRCSKFNRTQQWTSTTSKENHNMGYIKSLGSPYSPLGVPVRPHLEYHVHFWTSPFRSDAWKLWKDNETVIKMGQWATKQVCMDSPREPKLFVWKLRMDLVAVTTPVKSNRKIIAEFSLLLADNTTGATAAEPGRRFRLVIWESSTGTHYKRGCQISVLRGFQDLAWPSHGWPG